MPDCTRANLARLEALNSTGRVITWNRTAPVKNRIPRSISQVSAGLWKMKPMKNRGNAARLPKLATGAIAERMLSGT